MTRKNNETMTRKLYRLSFRIVRQRMNGNQHTAMLESGQERQLEIIENARPGMVERVIECLCEYGESERRTKQRDIRLHRELWGYTFEDDPYIFDRALDDAEEAARVEWWAAQVALTA